MKQKCLSSEFIEHAVGLSLLLYPFFSILWTTRRHSLYILFIEKHNFLTPSNDAVFDLPGKIGCGQFLFSGKYKSNFRVLFEIFLSTPQSIVSRTLIIEALLLKTMFKLPNIGDVHEVIINGSIVKNNSEPIVTLSKTKKTSAA